jgi:hypothetical protein
MHDFGIYDLAGLVAAGFIIVRVLGPLAVALAKRIEGRPPAAPDDSAARELRGELDELYERVDFLERALAARRPAAELPESRTPV